jgi:hypothetical protein
MDSTISSNNHGTHFYALCFIPGILVGEHGPYKTPIEITSFKDDLAHVSKWDEASSPDPVGDPPNTMKNPPYPTKNTSLY